MVPPRSLLDELLEGHPERPDTAPSINGDGGVSLESVLCTEELHRRPTRPPDHATENRALTVLIQALADSPQTILQCLTDTILQVLQAGSAGISLLTKEEHRFEWPAISGAWGLHIGEGTPRDFGPCGDVLDRNGPLLFQHVERRYPYFQSVLPAVEEALLVPFYIAGKAVGTVWAVSHDDRRRFDAEDLRRLESLARFASAAYRTVESTETLIRNRGGMESLHADLRASETRFRALFDSGPIAAYTCDASGAIQEYNASAVALWGREPLRGNPDDRYCASHKLFFPDGTPVPHDRTPVVDVLSGKLPAVRGAEVILERPDGSRLTVIANIVPLKNDRGEITGVMNCFYDITDRRIAEEALRSSEAFNRSIIESSPDCIKVLDLDGNLLSMESGQELLGIEDISPYLNKSWIEFWHGDDRRAARAAFDAALAGGAGNFVGFFRTLRGEPKWWDVAISPILDAAGRPASLLAVSRDVTDRKREELNLAFIASVNRDLAQFAGVDEMIRTVGAKIGAYLDLSLCAFVEIDEAAHEAVIFHDWHRDDVPGLVGAHRLTDFVEEDFIRAARAGEMIVVRDTAADPRTTPEKFAAFQIASFLCAPLIRDGQWRFALCLYHSAAYDWREDEIELARELTARIWAQLERLRAERKLHEQAEALADLHRRKDEFLAMLSHELRSPLAPISNAIQLLGLDTDERPVQKQARTVIERQVGQLTRLVDDLMEVSRITTGRVHLRKELVAIAGIVERAVETAYPMIEHRRHKLAVTVPPGPIWLDADAGRLEQVVVNLLTNAAKYTEVGGHIWLTVERSCPGGDRPEECVLRVRDTGVGIAPGLLPRIFDLFTQAERSLARSQGGLGIGLALVQRLVEMHGGTVEVVSTLGRGSEFIARLPVVAALPQKISPYTVTAVASRPALRVLVVDDNEDSAESLAMLLEASGQTVRTAYDGPNALETLLDYRPEVVMLDIGLPGIDGYEVAKRIRMQPAHQGAVLVALTGYGQESDRQLSRDAGFDHHLVKPADFAQLERILAGVAMQ